MSLNHRIIEVIKFNSLHATKFTIPSLTDDYSIYLSKPEVRFYTGYRQLTKTMIKLFTN